MNNKVANSLMELSKYQDQNICVSFSGGKDSLVVLDLAIRVGISKVMFCDTGLEFEETVDFVKEIEIYYGINIDIVKAPISFFDLAKKIGFPSRKCRWCSTVFKFGPQALYAVQNGIDGYITGIRREESNSRKYYQAIDVNPLVPVKQINPIIDWSEKEIWQYIHEENLPINPLYSLFSRVGCWCCPFKTKSEWDLVKKHFPHKYLELVTFLEKYAIENGISDQEKYIQEMKWTCWSSPINKVIAGSLKKSVEKNLEPLIEINFNTDCEKQINRVLNLINILNVDYLISNERFDSSTTLIVKNREITARKVNILVEKAINCQGCGACRVLCQNNALFLDNSILYVDANKCVSCLNCLKTNKLKGGCIIRNYSPKRASLIHL